MSELWEHTAGDLVRVVRRGEVSRREVVEAHLRRIEAVNGRVGALVELRDPEQVLQEAEAADRESTARSGLELDGVPVSIKDHFDVEGMKHTEAVRGLAERRSPGTTLAVRRLQDAGAIIVGKGNQPDFQIRWNTVNDLYGPTRNPRDLTRTVGGSSGGEAAAVTAGMAPIGLGADYGGSIRVPASFCGIFGLRPSAGRVPDVQALQPSLGGPTLDLMASNGPLARSLEDLWTSFVVLSGADSRDPASLPIPTGGPSPSAPSRAVVRMCRETGALIEPEIEHELHRVCDALAAAGYEVAEGGIPQATRAPELWAELVGAELLHSALPAWADLISDSARQHIETMFGLFDLGPSLERYIASYQERRGLAQQAAVWMDEHPLVVAPVAGMPTPALDFDHYLSLDATRDLFDHMRDVVWVNLLSLPSIALPNGIQIVARRFHEAEAFAAARTVVDALGWSSVPPAP